MEEEMAGERVEQEAVPVSEVWKDSLERADKALGQMSKGLRAAAFVGLIAGVTTVSQARTGEGTIESPAISTAEGKETTLEISATQIPPEIGVPTGSSAPEYARRVPVQVEEKPTSINTLAKEDPEKLNELEKRASAVVAYDSNGRQILSEDWREFRDFRIFDFHGSFVRGKELNYPNVLETLAQYELEFERNPAIERVLQEMSPGIRAMNEILRDKASPEWFKDEKIPQLPEDLRGRFVFEEGILPGLGWPYYPSVSLLGEYDSYEMVKMRLSYTGFHELIHSILQFESAIKPSPWIEQPEENREGLLKPENRRIHLAHEALDVLTLPAMEATGRPPTKIDSRILYIFWVLKREGASDPYKELLRAAVTMNGDRLWQVYEQARRPNDFSLDELFAYQERSPDGFYNNFDQEKALEELRGEYFPYLLK